MFAKLGELPSLTVTDIIKLLERSLGLHEPDLPGADHDLVVLVAVRVALDQHIDVTLAVEVGVSGETKVKRDAENTMINAQNKTNYTIFSSCNDISEISLQKGIGMTGIKLRL